MKVFISWSGERSRLIAAALYNWLPRVIQAVKPWMSEADISKGTLWEQEIGLELKLTKFGIICLTPENLDSRWINFEAGALSKTLEKTYVCTYLFELRSTDIEGPLSQFNHTKAEKEDTRRLIHTINNSLEGEALAESLINDAFEIYWPRLQDEVDRMPSADEAREPVRTMTNMVEEMLELIRSMYKVQTNVRQPPRLITTLGWPFEDAQALLSHYDDLVQRLEVVKSANEIDMDLKLQIERLETDGKYARDVLEIIRPNNQIKRPTQISMTGNHTSEHQGTTDENSNP